MISNINTNTLKGIEILLKIYNFCDLYVVDPMSELYINYIIIACVVKATLK